VGCRALNDRFATNVCQWRLVVATLVLSYRQGEKIRPRVHDSRHHHLAPMAQDGPMYEHSQAERENLLQDKSLMM
jgi:hypothetical protein